MRIFIILLLSLSTAAFAQRSPNPTGFYSAGEILFAWNLKLEDVGYMRLFTERNRGWGSREMITMVKKTASEMDEMFPMRDRLQVGDISAMGGGQITRHNSHQNGLDADLTYYRLNGVEQLPDIFDEFSENMIVNGKISPNFDHQRNWELMKSLHWHGKVQRIFADQLIKQELCRYAQAQKEDETYVEVLRSLRHVEDHSDHLHVRLFCPETAKNCIAQEETPPGSGCP